MKDIQYKSFQLWFNIMSNKTFCDFLLATRLCARILNEKSAFNPATVVFEK